MKTTIYTGLFLIVWTLFIFDTRAQSYVAELFSKIKIGHSIEAMEILRFLKMEMTACLMANEGKESACGRVLPKPSANFTYEFLQAPEDGSRFWSVKASGREAFEPTDSIVLKSNAQGGIVSCQITGKLTGAC